MMMIRSDSGFLNLNLQEKFRGGVDTVKDI